MRLARFTGRFYVSAAIALIVVLFGFVGPLVFSGQPNDVAGGLYDHPSLKAWLGTDNLGHNVFTNLMYGTRTSLIVGLVAGAGATLIGVLIGTAAGYIGGVVEEALMAFTNVILAIPSIVLLILISIALHSRSATSVALVIGVTAWPWTARAVRAQASSLRTRDHLDIARLSGAGPISMMAYDVVPYMLSYICMAFVLQVSSAVLTEAALALLGLGPSNGVSLGIMLHWALDWESVRTGAWWAFVPPTALLTLIAFALLMLQSSLDEVFNPRLRRGTLRRRGLRLVPAPTLVPAAGGAGAVIDTTADSRIGGSVADMAEDSSPVGVSGGEGRER